ncbi:MAG: class I tRNA ligase family protein [Thermoanaerobaculia bacterium]|nr:class I tRNA ligase family protein [Thermoanaerobaculia bacterium]
MPASAFPGPFEPTPQDTRRRALARQVRSWSVEDLHDAMESEGITRAFVVSENGQFTLSHPKLLRPVQAFFELSHDFADHEGVFLGREEGIPSIFLASVHDTRRGLAQGGLRFKDYANVADLLTDGLRLAQGMTRKNALAGLWWGGGKGIVVKTRAVAEDPEYGIEGTDKRLELFRAYGRFVASLGGVYYTAEDVGTKTSDMNAVLGVNRFTTCVAADLGGSGNPSPYTARGVFRAMQAAWRFLTGSDDLAGVGVAVQGVGNVGGPLVDLLHEAGAKLWLTDVDRDALAAFQAKYPGVERVGLDEIYDVPADIFAPCAVGAVINIETIPRLRSRLVCGAANNILRDPEDADRLRRRGIAYVPDYLCNRMGITNCCDEWQGYLPEDVALAAERVYPDTLRVLKHARSQIITSAAAADQLADLAACELHPMLGHRGRRIVDRLIADGWHHPERAKPTSEVTMAFDPGADEPAIGVRWEHANAFRGRGRSFAAAPISAAGRPDLSTLLSAVLMDVRARYHQRTTGERPRRVLGGDPGGLALQLAVERSLPFEREDIGRSRFFELCSDHHRRNDAAVREQLHQLGVGFDPERWVDPMSRDTSRVVRRLFHALDDAGLLRRESKLTFYDPSTQTVLIAPDVIRTQVEVHERYTLSYRVADGDGTIEVQTFFPELAAGAVALAVHSRGTYAIYEGRKVVDPITGDELPVIGVADLATDAKFLVPAHDRDDFELAAAFGLDTHRGVFDDRGLLRVPGEERPLERAQARRLVTLRFGDAIRSEEGSWWVDAFRARRSETLVNLGTSEQTFVDLSEAAAQLRQAISVGAVTFSATRWRERALAALDAIEPWCISRQYWWGHEMPVASLEEPDGEVLSVWFSLAAWSLCASGWPQTAEPEPIDEVWVDAELFERWALASQMVSLLVTGRPAFRHIQVHGSLHVSRRALVPRSEAGASTHDEERYVLRQTRRPMRRRLGNAVEPGTLVRRFGADALRLGYLLSLQSADSVVATASESHLRRARSTIQRLNSKFTGLFHRTRAADPDADAMPSALDRWLLGRCAEKARSAEQAYNDDRLDRVGRRLAEAAEDLSRFAGESVRRLDAVENEKASRETMWAIQRTLASALELLAEAFEPVAPYLFDQLQRFAARRAEPWEARPTADGDLGSRPPHQS